ncbi:hypothetical protein [Microbacterium sp. zg-YB36]|uniref:Mbeg1-like protein n=1 Tax=Microbacterium sp. zg-YB36 TaxID=2969407 RepID=UPI00214BFD27|nr:hypothetical protein [Microbacterium sp. zg-YB36]MDL5351150.1 hypothetical protein [Microbacterium sp. zg-YB36]
MSTWNAIVIEQPGSLTIDTLPDALTGEGEIWEGYDVTDERESRQPNTYYQGDPGGPGNPEGRIVISGHSKYEASAAIAALIELSKTTGTITHSEEYDYDEPGQEVTVYRAGGYVLAESRTSELVPNNLGELIAAVREGIALVDATFDKEEEHYAAVRTVMAARALISALTPNGGAA